jgi:hypothetical protein
MTKALLSREDRSGELVGRDLAARDDQRQVVTDPPARYYGVEVSARAQPWGMARKVVKRGFWTWLTLMTGQIAATSG